MPNDPFGGQLEIKKPVLVLPILNFGRRYHVRYNEKIGALISSRGFHVKVWSRFALPESVASFDIPAEESSSSNAESDQETEC